MKTRIISGVVLLPVLLGIVWLGGDILRISLLLLSLIGLHEFYKAINKENITINYFSYAFTVFYYAFLNNEDAKQFVIMMTLFTLVLFCYLVFSYPKVNISIVSTTILGVLYVPILLSYVYFVREMDNGIYYVWLILISAFATDTFAYFSGMFFGKHKLTPELSPNKTIEGSIGGILGTIVTTFIYAYILSKVSATFVFEPVLLLIAFVGSIFSQFGDLTASSIKRYTGIKDFGKIIPGHGGILDRFDSILFTAPIVYIMVYLLV